MNPHLTSLAIGRALKDRPALSGPVAASGTPHVIAPGRKTFTVPAGASWRAGQHAKAVSAANPAENFMAGTVVSYSGTSLVLEVKVPAGAGSYPNWSLSPGLHVYAHDVELLATGVSDKVAEMELPAIYVMSSGDALCGHPRIGKMKVRLIVGSQSDFETSAVHAAREKAVRDLMADTGSLTAAFAAIGGVLMKGPPRLVTNDPDVQARAFTTPLTYIVGVEEL